MFSAFVGMWLAFCAVLAIGFAAGCVIGLNRHKAQWRERVADEYENLAGRIEELSKLIDSDEFVGLAMPIKSMLVRQRYHMRMHAEILKERMEHRVVINEGTLKKNTNPPPTSNRPPPPKA